MGLHTLKKQQLLPVDIQEAWDFFSRPENLKIITPEYMGFNITSGEESAEMYPGMIITYKVSPFPFLTLDWVTEITHIQPPNYFVDEQRSGPYSFWHHKHFFKEVSGGVEIIDIVHYKIPFLILGDLANKLIVRKKLEAIFNYREDKLNKIFQAKSL